MPIQSLRVGKYLPILFVLIVLITNVVGAILQHQAKKREAERKAREAMERGLTPKSRPDAPRRVRTGSPERPLEGPLEARVPTGPAGRPIPAPQRPAGAGPVDVLVDQARKRLAELQRREAERRASLERQQAEGARRTKASAPAGPESRKKEPLRSRVQREHASGMPGHQRLGRLERAAAASKEQRQRQQVDRDNRARERERRSKALEAPRGRVVGSLRKESLLREAPEDSGPGEGMEGGVHWLREALRTPEDWKRAVMLREVLGPPVSMETPGPDFA